MICSAPRFGVPALLASLLILCSTIPLQAAGTPKPQETTSSESEELYELGKAAADREDFALALEYFEKAHEVAPKNPDVLNMLAYSLRKTGEIDRAIEVYHEALKLRPQFPEAREYLGEAHLQAALREIDTLRGYGAEAAEEAEELAAALKKAAAEIDD